jgi:serine/threonine protein kinase
MCFGTPHYMAPEQIMGKPVDKAVDVYALAVMSYELVAGRLPWDGDDPRALFSQVLKEPPPPLRPAHPSVTRVEELNRFFVRALAKQREDRPADVEGFFRELEQALLGESRPVPQLLWLDGVPEARRRIVLRSGEFPADDTVVQDDRANEPTATGDSSQPSGRPRTHQSGWMTVDFRGRGADRADSVEIEIAPVTPAPAIAPKEAAPVEEHRSVTRIATMPKRLAVPPWFIAVVIALLALAAAGGYLAGRHAP